MFLAPVLVKYMEENLDTAKPRYSEPLAFVISTLTSRLANIFVFETLI